MRRLSPATLALTAVLALGAGCGGNSVPHESREQGAVGGRIPVVATTTQLTDFARIVGGDHVDVYGILKANIDSHDYEPSPADLGRLARARVIVKNGVGLERWFEATIRSAGSKATIVEAATGVALRQEGDEVAEADPHIWHDPRNAKVMVHNVAAGLAAADPAHRADYEANEVAYAAEIGRASCRERV